MEVQGYSIQEQEAVIKYLLHLAAISYKDACGESLSVELEGSDGDYNAHTFTINLNERQSSFVKSLNFDMLRAALVAFGRTLVVAFV